jgi:hypothetical protein
MDDEECSHRISGRDRCHIDGGLLFGLAFDRCKRGPRSEICLQRSIVKLLPDRAVATRSRTGSGRMVAFARYSMEHATGRQRWGTQYHGPVIRPHGSTSSSAKQAQRLPSLAHRALMPEKWEVQKDG